MKKIFVFAALAFLVACKEKGDTRTPKGIIITAVQALSEGNTEKFKGLLADRALQNYGTAAQQSQLKSELGDVRQLGLSSEKILSHSTQGNSTTTISQVDVMKSNQVVRNVITRCVQTSSTYTHQVCHTYDPNPGYSGGGYDNGDNGNYGGGYSGGDGGYEVPGPSHPATGGGSDDGHKPGNQDPDRPGRYPIIVTAEWSYDQTTECHDETSSDVSVSCSIIDLK
jgi:hypothetical protein